MNSEVYKNDSTNTSQSCFEYTEGFISIRYDVHNFTSITSWNWNDDVVDYYESTYKDMYNVHEGFICYKDAALLKPRV